MPGLFDVRDKTILVTGASQGIGRSLALGLNELGARVLAHGPDAESLAELAPVLGTRPVVADFTEADAAAQVAAQLNGIRALDGIVNNAGIELAESRSGPTLDAFARTMAVNAYAPVALTLALLPKLRLATSPSVVAISSIHQDVPYPFRVAYGASKAALASETATLAVQLAGDGIRVNAIAPGAIETDINRHVIEAFGRDHFERKIPLERVGAASDVLGAVVFLLSPASSYVTGAFLHVDGGLRHSVVDYAEPAVDPVR